jgi:large subunit ribosomal protein L25
VHISAKPGDIPAKLVLDIADLGLGDTLHVSDLPLPEGVTFSDSPKLTIVTCIAPKGLKSDKVEEEVADAAEPAAAEEAAK